MENAEVKLVESRICIQQTIGSLSIVPLMVPGVNHALQELLFTIKNVDNVKLLEMDLVLDQVSTLYGSNDFRKLFGPNVWYFFIYSIKNVSKTNVYFGRAS